MFNLFRKKIGIIGFGNMGSAIAERIKSNYEVFVFEKDSTKVSQESGLTFASSVAQLLQVSQVVILAVKPQDFEQLMPELKDRVRDKLIISIAAGINTGYIEKVMEFAKVVRAMPNLAAKVGRSTTSICKGAFAEKTDMEFANKLFKNIGEVFILTQDMMDAATAIAGSGPGFWCELIKDKPRVEWEDYNSKKFIPELTSAAEFVGFDKKTAGLFAASTVNGALVTIDALGITPDELKAKITSKGGTTEAGLEALNKTGSLIEAAKAAVKRSKELSRR